MEESRALVVMAPLPHAVDGLSVARHLCGPCPSMGGRIRTQPAYAYEYMGLYLLAVLAAHPEQSNRNFDAVTRPGLFY
jgi:hypothetical protein